MSKKKEEEEKYRIRKGLVASGEMNKLKEGLKSKLHETGWYEDIRMFVKGGKYLILMAIDFLEENGDKSSVEEIYEKTLQRGKEKLDEKVKANTLAEIRKSMDKIEK